MPSDSSAEGSGGSGGLAARGDWAGRNSYPEGPLLAGPMLGEIGVSDAYVWVQARDTAELTLQVHKPDGTELLQTAQPAAEQWLCLVFHIAGLTAGGGYEYSLRSIHGQTPRYPLRLAPSAQTRKLKLALGSCYKDYQTAPLPIFTSIANEVPDLFLMLGDNCYFVEEREWNSEGGMMLAHLRNRNHDSLRPLLAQVPVLGIWDDHDFGPNDSDGTFVHKATSLRCFQRMWAQRNYGTDDIPGIFSAVRCGPVEIFLCDGRYERRARQQILGPAQLGWLKQRLRQSNAPVKLVLSGSQFLPEVPALAHFNWECWHRDARAELAELRAFIEKEDIQGVLLASGDPHLGYVLHARGRELADGRIGPELWELTTSPLAHAPWAEHLWPADSRDPRFFDRYILFEWVGQNYGLIDLDLDRSGEELRLQLKDAQGSLVYSQSVALSSLQVRSVTPKRSVALGSSQHAYVFKAKEYVRYDLRAGSAPQARSTRLISAGWKGVFPEDPGVDAVLMLPNGKAYFFKGNGYVRYDLAADHVDPGYPKYLARHFPGVWSDGLDAACAWTAGKAYFFKGRECLRYDITADHTDAGYPRPISEEFPGIWADGIDSAVLWPSGKAYFFRGQEYVRYDLESQQPDPGYPKALADDWLGIVDE